MGDQCLKSTDKEYDEIEFYLQKAQVRICLENINLFINCNVEICW